MTRFDDSSAQSPPERGPSAKDWKRALPRAIRICFAVGLVALLVYGVDWKTLPALLGGLAWFPAALAIAGLWIHFLISPWKWQQALRMHALRFDLPYLVRANGTGFFLNNFLPSGLGGDAYRVMATLPPDGHRSRAISAVIIERIVGFAALMLIGELGALVLFQQFAIARTFVWVTLIGGAATLVCGGAVYFGWMKWLTGRVGHTKVFTAIRHNIAYLRQGGQRWLSLIAISLLFQLIAIVNAYFLFQALGTDVSMLACAVIGAVAGLSTIIPLSINGIGIVEGSFAGTAVALGVPYEPALAVAILIRVLVLPPSLAFGALYVFQGDPALRRAGATAV